jgi:hypothetical protein
MLFGEKIAISSSWWKKRIIFYQKYEEQDEKYQVGSSLNFWYVELFYSKNISRVLLWNKQTFSFKFMKVKSYRRQSDRKLHVYKYQIIKM